MAPAPGCSYTDGEDGGDYEPPPPTCGITVADQGQPLNKSFAQAHIQLPATSGKPRGLLLPRVGWFNAVQVRATTYNDSNSLDWSIAQDGKVSGSIGYGGGALQPIVPFDNPNDWPGPPAVWVGSGYFGSLLVYWLDNPGQPVKTQKAT